MQEALNLQQRRKRANIAHRNKNKLERAREISQKKLAPESNIKKRAFALARQILRKKIAGGRGAEYQTLGPTEKEAIDKQLDKRKALIKKIAARLMPRVKQSEQHRLQSFLKGAAMKNIDEAFEKKFANKKKKKTGESGYIKILDKFSEESELDTKAYKALVRKADKYEVDLDIVAEIYNSAFDDYDYADTTLSEQQFAFARVNHELNELSKSLVGSYIKAAGEDRVKIGTRMRSDDMVKRLSAGFDNSKRRKGSDLAVKRLTKEDTLDELSKSTLKSYIDKSKSNTENLEKAGSYSRGHGRLASDSRHIGKLNRKITNRKQGQLNATDRLLQREEIFVESKNTPYVKQHIEDNKHVGWKASNQHGKVKYFQLAAKSAANTHAGLTEALNHDHPIVKEYKDLKTKNIKQLRDYISQSSKVIDVSGFRSKDHAISHLLRAKHGNKHVDNAFGLKEETLYENFKKGDYIYLKTKPHLGSPNGGKVKEVHDEHYTIDSGFKGPRGSSLYKVRKDNTVSEADYKAKARQEYEDFKKQNLKEDQVAEYGKLVKSYKTAQGNPFDLFQKGDTHTLIKRDGAEVSDTYTGKLTREIHKTLLKRFIPEETLDEGRFIVSGVHQDHGKTRTKIYQANSTEHAKEQFTDDHGDNYGHFKVKNLRLPKLRGESVEHENCGTPDCCGQCEPEPVNEFLLTATVLALKNRKKIAVGIKSTTDAYKNRNINAANKVQQKQSFQQRDTAAKETIANKNLSSQDYLKKREAMIKNEELGPENQIGTPALTRKLKKLTPGQEQAQVNEAVDSQKEKINKLNSKTRRQVSSNQSKLDKNFNQRFNKKPDLDEACWKGYTQLGMKKKGKKIVPNCVKEDVKSAEMKGVIVPAYIDAYGNTIPAKVVKRKVGNKILKTGDPHDGI